MPRHTRVPVFRIRYRDGINFHSRLFVGRVPSRPPGRVLRISKVGYEDLFHVGGSNQLIKGIMRDLKKEQTERRVGTTGEPISDKYGLPVET